MGKVETPHTNLLLAPQYLEPLQQEPSQSWINKSLTQKQLQSTTIYTSNTRFDPAQGHIELMYHQQTKGEISLHVHSLSLLLQTTDENGHQLLTP